MTITLILVLGAGAIVLGRLLFDRWFNHVSIYAFLWSASLALYEVRMIGYHVLAPETWMIIISAFLSFLFGCLAVQTGRSVLGKQWQGEPSQPERKSDLDQEHRLIRRTLLITSAISFVVAIQHWTVVLQKFGSIEAVILWGNLLYNSRIHEGLPGAIPYFASLALTGTMFAGAYTASSGRITPLSVIPFLIVVLIELANMGRAKMVMAAILFLSGYFFYKERLRNVDKQASRGRSRQVLSLLFAIVLLVASAELVRSVRGGNESFSGSTKMLRSLEGSSFLTPSLYMYATIHPGVLNQYLKEDREHTPWGSNTFAPVYRILAKLGFDTKVNTYQIFYYTPAPANTGTYLREIHADFGLAGVAVVPFLLGVVTTVWWFRMRERFRFFDCAIATYLFVIVAMTLLYGATRAGDLLSALLAGVFIGAMIDRTLIGARPGATADGL
jgi:oligosaccharide repeat unit polymerase